MLTDEELAEIAWDARGWSIPLEKVSPPTHSNMIAGVRAIRAALLPDVAPLAPGETGEIPSLGQFALNVSASPHGRLGVGGIRLDAAGVAQLETVCRRWRRAQQSTNDGTIAAGHQQEGGV